MGWGGGKKGSKKVQIKGIQSTTKSNKQRAEVTTCALSPNDSGRQGGREVESWECGEAHATAK